MKIHSPIKMVWTTFCLLGGPLQAFADEKEKDPLQPMRFLFWANRVE